LSNGCCPAAGVPSLASQRLQSRPALLTIFNDCDLALFRFVRRLDGCDFASGIFPFAFPTAAVSQLAFSFSTCFAGRLAAR
jgi:hypothetical protein